MGNTDTLTPRLQRNLDGLVHGGVTIHAFSGASRKGFSVNALWELANAGLVTVTYLANGYRFTTTTEGS